MEALLTQRRLAERIRRPGGHALLVVKANQPALHTAADRLFTEAPAALPIDRLETRAGAHSRARRVSGLARRWAGAAAQPPRHRPGDGQVRLEVTDCLLSPRPEGATAAAAAARWRGRWTIANRVRYVRDVSLGEDAGQQRLGGTPRALAALRNGALDLLRASGWPNTAYAPAPCLAAAPRTEFETALGVAVGFLEAMRMG